MSSFGALAVCMGEMAFGAKAIYWGDPSFGATAVYWGDPSFGASKVYMGQMAFGAQACYLGSCFPKTELVHKTSDEYVPIGSLKSGDKISSWDIERKKLIYTVITKIHKYTVMDIISFNNDMQVSFTHPLLVMEKGNKCVHTLKWKVAFDVNVGDCLIGSNGKPIIITSKKKHKYNSGIEVLNLSTDCGLPFFVGNSVVRAENAHDNMEWADAPITKTLAA